MFNPDYEEIKAFANAHKCSVKTLLALSPNNDPFYCGMPSQVDKAKWFKGLWDEFGYTNGVHCRRMHYQIVSQHPPVLMVNGKPYENTEKCWKELQNASQAARYLDYVDAECFVDRRNGAPKDLIDYDTEHYGASYVAANDPDWFQAELPEFAPLPSYAYGLNSPQPYHLEIWCEKSTMDDILTPLAEEYGLALQYGLGELSVTLSIQALRRFERSQKPIRIFYISDFDPAGLNMPRSMSAKLQRYNLKLGLDLDIKLFPLVLTADQAKAYNLPRTPIKDTDKRKSKFEERFGVGATELDALESQIPGELRRLLVREIEKYYDTGLKQRLDARRKEVNDHLGEVQEQVYDRYRDRVQVLEQEWQAIRDAFNQQVSSHMAHRQQIWQAIHTDLEKVRPAVKDEDVPRGKDADESIAPFALFDSSRDYLTQNDVYQRHKGNGDDSEDEIA